MISPIEMAPCACVSLIVFEPICSLPPPVCTIVSGLTTPRSSASEIVNGFSVEPGS